MKSKCCKHIFLLLALVGAFWMQVKGYSTSAGSSDRPNIVFLFSDDQSVPDLGAYGNESITTPNLDRLASQGLQFERAYVSSPQCSPSRASILTGKTPHSVQASRLHEAVPEHFNNIVELLNESGYYTGAYRKIHQETIADDFDYYGGSEVALENFFNELPGNSPFFLWFGSTDPHRSYKSGAFQPSHKPSEVTVPDFLPDTPIVRQDLAYYYDEIARFDKECGIILKELEKRGFSENTLVVMSSDNGMPFPRAKASLYEKGIQVPLIIRWPGNTGEGTKTDELVSLGDLAATWLDVAGVSVPGDFQAHSLLPLLKGQNFKSRQYIFAEINWHDFWQPARTVVGKRYKLIQRYRPEFGLQFTLDRLHPPPPNNSFQEILRLQKQGALEGNLKWYYSVSKERPRIEFYDLQEDPGEWNNLANNEDYQEKIKEFQLALANWMNDTNDFLPPPRIAFPGGIHSHYNQTVDPLNAVIKEKE